MLCFESHVSIQFQGWAKESAHLLAKLLSRSHDDAATIWVIQELIDQWKHIRCVKQQVDQVPPFMNGRGQGGREREGKQGARGERQMDTHTQTHTDTQREREIRDNSTMTDQASCHCLFVRRQ